MKSADLPLHIAMKAEDDGLFAIAHGLLELNKTLDFIYQRLGSAALEDMNAKQAIAKAIDGAGQSIGSALSECSNAIGTMPG